MEVKTCPFCGNPNVVVHHGVPNITMLLCGDDVGNGGCGAVVSFRPCLLGSAAITAYNRRSDFQMPDDMKALGAQLASLLCPACSAWPCGCAAIHPDAP